jgi:hypothetical protein
MAAPIGEPDAVHTFKNYLHLTLSYCALLLDELPPDSPAREDVLEIQKAVQHAVGMLPQLLAAGYSPEGKPASPGRGGRS